MSRTSNTKRYYEIARDCLRSAQHADNPATRDKLLDQAQVWMDAAMRETFIATIGAGDPHEPSRPEPRNEARALRSGSRGQVAVVLDLVNPVEPDGGLSADTLAKISLPSVGHFSVRKAQGPAAVLIWLKPEHGVFWTLVALITFALA